MENNGMSVSRAMRKAGYGKGYAKNPHLFTKSKTWQEMMEEYIPDELIVSKHKELLNKTDDLGVIDVNAVKAGVDMGYKLKKRYENPVQEIIVRDFDDMNDEELQKYIDDRYKKLNEG
jgi:hypothetical protein